jgi:SDR family mycofactocin-dependent oxidoreductase
MGRLEGQVAWITGGARGQGRAIAERFAREGADIVISDVASPIEHVPYPVSGREDLEAARLAVEATGQRCLAEIADVRDQAALDAVVARAIEHLGGINILCSNHGIVGFGQSWEITDEQWSTQLDINLTGAWRAAKAVIPHMLDRSGGVILLTSSINGREATPNMSHYTAAKHGVVGLMKSLALELGPHDVRVNALLTGSIHTPMGDNPMTLRHLFGREGATTEDYLEATRHWHVLRGRAALPPEAVADAMLWLASDEARHVTGIELILDAGHSVLPGYNPDPIVP